MRSDFSLNYGTGYVMREHRCRFTQEAGLVRGICGEYGEYETTEVRDVRIIGVGAGCVGGQGKGWMGCFLDDLRAFGINADQWTTAAQDEGEWRKTVEQRVEHFMAKWIAAEKAKAVDYGMQSYTRT